MKYTFEISNNFRMNVTFSLILFFRLLVSPRYFEMLHFSSRDFAICYAV